MAKPTPQFRQWAASVGIREGTHDWSIALAAWCAAVKAMDSKAKGATK